MWADKVIHKALVPILFRLLVFSLPIPCLAQHSPMLVEAQRSLQAKKQCVAFRWEANASGSPRGAMIIPVQVNGQSFWFQLDTGANANIIYSNLSDHAGWSRQKDTHFEPGVLRIGGIKLHRRPMYIAREMKTGSVSGTIGLPSLVGFVSVIDYPGQRFCLFEAADQPAALAAGLSVDGTLRNGKLFLPLQSGAFQSDSIIFDTGSSEFPLRVDFKNWTIITGITDDKPAPIQIQGSAWGKSIVFSGGPALSKIQVGTISEGATNVFVNSDKPTEFGSWPFKTDGTVGNALFWQGLLVIDLTGAVQLRYLK